MTTPQAHRRPKSFPIVLFILLSFFLSPSLTHAGELTWLNDYQTAVKEAKSSHKKIFLLFTGGSWCGVCVLAERNLFQTPQFVQYAKDNLVLLKVSFSSISDIIVLRDPADQEPYRNEGAGAGDAIDQGNKRLKDHGRSPGQELFVKYAGVDNGVPTVELLNENGDKMSEINTGINAVTSPVGHYLASIDKAMVKK